MLKVVYGKKLPFLHLFMKSRDTNHLNDVINNDEVFKNLWQSFSVKRIEGYIQICFKLNYCKIGSRYLTFSNT